MTSSLNFLLLLRAPAARFQIYLGAGGQQQVPDLTLASPPPPNQSELLTATAQPRPEALRKATLAGSGRANFLLDVSSAALTVTGCGSVLVLLVERFFC